VHVVDSSSSRFNGFSHNVRSSKPLKRLGWPIRVFTGLKDGVNE
jgi:hypothetical protein